MPLLSPQQKTQLAAELAKPAYAGLSDQAAAALLNAPTAGAPAVTTAYPAIETLSALCLKFGLTGRCEVVLLQPLPPASDPAYATQFALAALCSSTLALLRNDFRLQSADVLDPDFVAGLDTFVALGWLSEAQRDVITSLQHAVAGPPGPSPATALGALLRADGTTISGQVDPEHVAEARA